MHESFQPFEEEKVVCPVALFAPNETLKIQQYKQQKIQTNNQINTKIQGVLVVCSDDGRLRVFINDRLDGGIREEYEEEDSQFPDFEGNEVSVHESDKDSDSDYEEEKE